MKKILIIFTTFFFVLSIKLAHGTPIMESGIAIDNENNFCYSFQGHGYEDFYDGKDVFYPTTYININTDFGNCHLEYSASYLDCCKQLKLTPFDFEKIKDDYKDLSSVIRSDEPRICGPKKYDNGIGWDKGISVNAKTMECTSRYIEALLKDNNNGGITIKPNSCISDDWTEYVYSNYEHHIITFFGKCENFTWGTGQSCCEKLGLKYNGKINVDNDNYRTDKYHNTETTNEEPTNNEKNIFVTIWKSLLHFIKDLFE